MSAIATHPVELLDQLCELSGVLGAFLVASDGDLLAQVLPPKQSHLAVAAAQRLPLLLDALAAGHKAQSFSLRFAEHRLHLQSLDGAVLAVLTELSCNTTLLKMTLNLVGKRLVCLVPP